MSEADNIEDKIRKLLRLAGSANEHEAQLALERAYNLAARHRINIGALELDPDLEKIVEHRVHCGLRVSYLTRLALVVLVRFFHVSVLTSRPHVIFFGAQSDCVVAEYVHQFLTATCRRHLRDFEKARPRKASEAIRKNFVAGWFYGIHHQLGGAEEQLILEDSRLAIVAADQERRREEFRNSRYKTKSVVLAKVRRNEGALMSGFRRGRETQIRPAVNDAQRPLRLNN